MKQIFMYWDDVWNQRFLFVHLFHKAKKIRTNFLTFVLFKCFIRSSQCLVRTVQPGRAVCFCDESNRLDWQRFKNLRVPFVTKNICGGMCSDGLPRAFAYFLGAKRVCVGAIKIDLTFLRFRTQGSAVHLKSASVTLDELLKNVDDNFSKKMMQWQTASRPSRGNRLCPRYLWLLPSQLGS